MKNTKEFIKVITVKKKEVLYIEDLLDKSNSSFEGEGIDLDEELVDPNSVILSYTAKFEDGCEADIKFVSTDDDVYIDAVLFDQEGHQIALLDPCYEFLGEFEFEVEDFINIRKYTVDIVQEEEWIAQLGKRRLLMKTRAGSYNYNLMTEDSDEDYKVYVAPSLDDLFVNKLFTNQITGEYADYDCHDIRRLAELLRKSNINFIEGLFSDDIVLSKDSVVNTLFDRLISMREDIAKMNLSYLYDACVGMSYNKRKLAEREGCECTAKKNLMTSYRMLDFLQRYYDNDFSDFGSAIRYRDSERGSILSFKEMGSLESLDELDKKKIEIDLLKETYRKPFNEETYEKLNWLLKQIMLRAILMDLSFQK